MAPMTRRDALGALGSLVGVGVAGAITLIPAEAKPHKKKHKHKKHKHKKRGTGSNTPGDGIPNPGGGDPGGETPNPGGDDPGPQPVIVTETFTHAGAVGIDTEGPAKEYPSEIVVDRLDGGKITKVTVRIPGFQHDFPDDVDMLLVGPQGQNVLLMSDVGGKQTGTVLFDLTFDDDAATELPDEGPLTNGTFRPTNVDNLEIIEFPPPAPASGFGTTLGVFNGTNPAGTWQLFIVDDAPNDGGVLIGGWSLTISAEVLIDR
jgi:subtilisin-like proprotein convertase family protein